MEFSILGWPLIVERVYVVVKEKEGQYTTVSKCKDYDLLEEEEEIPS